MLKMTVGLAAILAAAFAGSALGGGVQDQIQEEEQPGSEIEMQVGPGGNVEIGRENKMKGPVEIEGGAAGQLQPLDDPDAPANPDPIDDELPGEGPEDLSGPDADDPLPE